jgi:hypothetical protein
MTTQNCAECGTRAEPGQPFCDACGAVLSWTEQAGAARSADRAARAGAAAAETSGPSGTSGSSGGGAAAASPGEPGEAGEPGERGEAAPTPPDTTGTGASGGERTAAAPPDTPPGTDAAPRDEPDATIRMRAAAPEDATSDRARPLVVPVADPAGAAAPPSVSPVLPGRPAAKRPQARGIGHEPGAHGGPPCPWCGTANLPDRHFCARCAMPMAQGQQAGGGGGRRPWWRRILDARNREAPWAGERPRLRRTFGHVVRWLVAAIVLTLLILLAVRIPDGVHATRDHFAKRAPVEPGGFRALHSYEDHPARLAFDKLNDTWWGPGVSESGEGEWIEARFEEPTRLLDLVITPGVSTRAEQLRESALPHRFEVLITTADGSTTTRELTLDQGLGPQRLAFRADGVTGVRLTIASAYGASPDKQVAIAEIEFFGPSSGSIL